MTQRTRRASSFEGLLEPFSGGVNARWLERSLRADFEGLTRAFAGRAEAEGGVLQVDEALLLSAPGLDPRAVDFLREDLRRLAALGRQPQLNVITRYPRDERGLPVRIDVHSFHVDRAPVDTDTFLCTYAGACSEGLDNDDAVPVLARPEVAALARAGEEHLELHYELKPGARPYPLGVGALWRLAVDWPGARVPPCIHRAPAPDGRPRLLLIS